ncbi:putative alkaline phosphatase [Synechococcus sp. A18-40]|nr:putative alkaline phosphatase [Synechococcus sp. A18-40]
MARISDSIISPLQSVSPGGAEKVDWFAPTKTAFVITGEYTDDKGGQVVAIDYSNGYGKGTAIDEYYFEGDVSDVRVSSQGLIAASVFDKVTREGTVQFLDFTKESGFTSLGSVEVGYQPDQLAFTKNGKKLVTANEGEPLMFYGSDETSQNPRGSISIINIANDLTKSKVNTLYFTKSNKYYEKRGVRLYGPEMDSNSKFGEYDIEPEYVGITGNNTALVALQENNALARVNLKKEKITGVFGLGYKDWSGIPFDTTDKDDGYNPTVKEGVTSARMPDGIDTFQIKLGGKKQILFISPNEGDGRVRPDDVNFEAPADGVYSWGTNSTGAEIESFTDPLTLTDEIYIYDKAGVGNSGDIEDVEEGDEFFITQKYGVSSDDEFWSDEVRAKDLEDFGDVSKYDSQIIGEGRMKTLADQNDPVTGGLVGFGGRGFSIHTNDGSVLYDSGNLTEEIAAELGYYPDNRSDDKGTEPETVEYFSFGKKKNKRHYIAVALERCFNNGDEDRLGTIVPIFEVVDLEAADNDERVKHVATLQSPESLSPEGLLFVNDTNTSGHMFVTNEVSRTLDTYAISQADLA